MSVADYPSFKCAVSFPKSMFDGSAASTAEPEAEQPKEQEQAEEQDTAEDTVETEPKAAEKAEESKPEPKPEPEESKAEEPEPEPEKPKAEEKITEEAKEPPKEVEEEKPAEPEPEQKQEEQPESEVDPEQQQQTQAEQEPVGEPESTVVVEEQTTTESASVTFGCCAKDIMNANPVWVSGDESVQQGANKLSGSGYLLVGDAESGKLEGIVSRSDLAGAISPYIRPLFVKWHRPLDDASLKIKIKWIMSRPVHAVKAETVFASIIETMMRFGVRCLPVVGEDGKILGLITAYDVFKVMLKEGTDAVSIGEAAQHPLLV